MMTCGNSCNNNGTFVSNEQLVQLV